MAAVACDTAHGLSDPSSFSSVRLLVTQAGIYTANAEQGEDGEPIPADEHGIVQLETARIYMLGFVLAATRPGHCIAYQVSTSWPGGASAAGACQARRRPERIVVRLATPPMNVEPDVQRITIFVEERGPSLEVPTVGQVDLDVRFLR